jgi:hypothetical protein
VEGHGNKWVCLTSLSGMSAKIFEQTSREYDINQAAVICGVGGGKREVASGWGK